MVDELILTPGCKKPHNRPIRPCGKPKQEFLEKDNYLSEFNNEEIEIVKQNLKIPDISNLLTKEEAQAELTILLLQILELLLPQLSKEQVSEAILTTLSDYVKKDGSIPFAAAILGVNPILDNDLTTKKYVDELIAHIKPGVDEELIKQILTKELPNLPKSDDVYNKEEVNALLKEVLTSESLIPLLSEYLKIDGSTPFINPLKGVKAISDDELVTLKLLKDEIAKIPSNPGTPKIDSGEAVWRTRGPVLTTVGLVDDDTTFPSEMTFQQTMDAIFYGFGAKIDAPEYVTIGDSTDIIVTIDGGDAFFSTGAIYLDNELLRTLSLDDLDEDNQLTIKSKRILEDSELRVEVTGPTGLVTNTIETILCDIPEFIGLLPADFNSDNINYETFHGKDWELLLGWQSKATHDYSFVDVNLRIPVVAIPIKTGELKSMDTSAQSFGAIGDNSAFTKIDKVINISEDVLEEYHIYLYKLPLSRLNQTVTFKFNLK